MTFRSPRSSDSASLARNAPGIRNTTSRPEWRRRPDRWDRELRTRWAWPLPSAGWRLTSTRPSDKIVDYRVYSICSDGDMMEGISHEAAALAGHLKLSNLIWLYDSNHVSLDGPTSLAYSDDVESRFKGYHWNVLTVEDANDLEAVEAAIRQAQTETERPTLIIVHTHIGYGSPHKQDTSAAHGEPLGVEEVKATKRFYGWPEDAQFLIPEEVGAHMGQAVERGKKLEAEWKAKHEAVGKEES